MSDDFRTRLYRHYVLEAIPDPDQTAARPALVRDIVPRLPPDRGARILEIGCGSGTLVQLLTEHGYTDVRGIDASPEQVELARQAGLRNVEQADLVDYLANSNQPFDAVVALDVIEHFDPPDVLEVLDRAFSRLAPGGRLVVRSPNAEGPFAGRYRYWDFTHGVAFTPPSIRQVLFAAGFDRVAVYPQEPVAHGVISFIRLVLWRLISVLVKGYLAVETGVPRGHIVTQNLIAVAVKPS